MTNTQLAIFIDQYLTQLKEALDLIKKENPVLSETAKDFLGNRIDYFPTLQPIANIIDDMEYHKTKLLESDEN